MKAVILAAGQGTRIRSVHGERPKCLIEVDNTTILDHQARGFIESRNQRRGNCCRVREGADHKSRNE